MTYKIKYIGIGSIVALLCLATFGVFYTVKANPSFFVRGQSSTTDLTSATTGSAFMTAGTGTTTLSLDLGLGSNQGADSAVLNIQFAGSSTSATLNADIQYSQDNTIWYASSPAATSSPTQSISSVQTISLPFASSTISRAAVSNANSATTTRSIVVPTPTRYVRALFYLPSGSTNGTVWAEFVAKRQAN